MARGWYSHELSSKVRFAVIGAGVIGDVHAQAIWSLPDVAEMSLVVSTREGYRPQDGRDTWREGYSTDDDAVLADPHIDLEREIANTPGTFFFCCLLYADDTDFPAAIELGVLRPDGLYVERFRNRFDLSAGTG